MAVVAAIIIGGGIYRELNMTALRKATLEGGVQTAVVMLLVATSALLGDYLTEARVPQQVAEGIMDFTDNRFAILGVPRDRFAISAAPPLPSSIPSNAAERRIIVPRSSLE